MAQDTSGAVKRHKLLLNGEGIYLRDSTWKLGGYIGFNLAQTALYQWSPGGTNSFSFLFTGNFYAKYKKKKLSWDSNIDLKYGMIATGLIRDGEGLRNFQKSIDLLSIATNIGYDITDHLYFSGQASFVSQFSRTYDYSQTDTANGAFKRYAISKFGAPAFITFGPGLTWKPKGYFTLYFSPVQAKFVVVAGPDKDTSKLSDLYYTGIDPTRYGLTPGSTYQASLGASLDILFQKDIVKNVNWRSHLNVYVAYVGNNYDTSMPFFNKADTMMETKTIKESTKSIPVVSWDNDIVCKINKYLSATLSTRFFYQFNAKTPVDQYKNSTAQNPFGTGKGLDGLTDVDKTGAPVLTYNKLQIFEQFGVGLSFKF
jgi:hypothetical protein